MSRKTDKEIVALALKDDKHFGALVERYEAKLLRYIMRFTQTDQQTAEDILQEAFLKVYKNLNDYDEQFTFSSWIYRLTRNQAIDEMRKNKKHKTVSIDNEDFNENFIEIFADDTDLAKEVSNKENAEHVRQIITKLPDKYREALILRYLEDKSYQEISDILQKSMGYVSSLINRAKEQFKKEYKHSLT